MIRSLIVVVVLGVISAGLHANPVREPRADLETLVQVELATVAVDPIFGTPLVLLRDTERVEVVLIIIGVAEARAILMAMQAVPVPRPMTHDLLAGVLEALDARLVRVLVDDLADNTFFGLLELEVKGSEETLYVDARPSDALALAARTGAPVYAAPKVLDSGRDQSYQAIQEGNVVTALGTTVVEASEALRGALGLPADAAGVVVSRTTGVAAERGLAAGALIVELNGESVSDPMHYLRLAGAIRSDESVTIRYWHGGEYKEIKVPADLPRRPALDV